MAEEFDDRTREVISDWAACHGFSDECGYPLVSPSEVVLDDLVFRLALAGRDGSLALHEVDKLARERWQKIPWQKGMERRLRRKEKET